MSWPKVALGDAVTFKGGGTPSRKDPDFWDGPIPWATVKDLNSGYALRATQESITEEGLRRSASNLIPAGTIVIPTRMALGKAVVSEVDVAINQDLKAVFPVKELDTRFLLWFFIFHSSRIEAMGKGATVKGVTLDQLRAMEIPLPSMEEQRRMAAILDKADALRAKRREAIAKLDQLLQSVFLDMFGDTGRWPMVEIGEICEVKGGKRLPKGEDYAESTTPFRYVRVSDIEMGRVREASLKYLKPEVQQRIKRYTVSKGDVIITIAGTIGVVAPVGGTLHGANLTENAAKLVPKSPDFYAAEFLSFALSMPEAQSQIRSRTGQVTIGKLALFRIEKVAVPLPPIEAQIRFTQVADNIRQQKSSLQQSAEQLDTLFASLQHRAFTGTL